MFKFLKRKESFEPAIYYGKLPKEFKNAQPIRAVRVSLEGGSGLYEIDNPEITEEELNDYQERTKKEKKPFLEKKVIESIRKSEGDIVLLEEPNLRITSWKIFKKEKYCRYSNLLSLHVFMSVNGVLYKTKSIETCFEED